MNDMESKAIWLALVELQAKVQELSDYGKVQFGKIQAEHVKQVEENRAVYRHLCQIDEKLTAVEIKSELIAKDMNLIPICTRCNGSGKTWK